MKAIQRFLAALGMTILASVHAADITVTAGVDQRRVAFGDSLTYSITVEGATSGVNPSLTPVDGLQFDGPSLQTSMQIVNGQMSQSVMLVYRVTPQRPGEFTIPANAVDVAGKKFQTEPITITVVQGAVASDWKDRLFGKFGLETTTLYVGQTVPVQVQLFTRQDVAFRGVSGFQCQADDLGFQFLKNLKQGTQSIGGELFHVVAVDGALSPTKPGKLTLGPCALRVRVGTGRRVGFFGDEETRDLPVTVDAVPLEVLPLPVEGQPPEFAGAVGQWQIEMTAKPTEVPVGEPITVNVRVHGVGNIDLVPTPQLSGLDGFKAYDPTPKTTKNELGTEGARELQQVLVPKSTDVKEIPAVRLSYFDPVEKQYKPATAGPIALTVKPGAAGQTTVVAGDLRLRAPEKLGEDIVYLKGDLGPGAEKAAMPGGAAFLTLNLAPVVALAGGVIWKRRQDKLRGDVAYARRSRAVKNAQRRLASAQGCDDVRRALQHYLGDRLNIPSSGITAAVVEEHPLPADAAQKIRALFEACDAARFAGAPVDLADLRQRVEHVIDELEKTNRRGEACLAPTTAILLLCVGATGVFAKDELKTANQLFDAQQYAEAAAAYERIEPKTAHVYFNLGNAYFRQEQLGRAILNYERARRRAPRDPDILANLKFAEDRLGVVEANTAPQPIRRFWQSVVGSRTLREWSRYELTAVWLTVAAVATAVWWPRWRTVFATAAVVLCVGWVTCATALGGRLLATRAPAAVVIVPQAESRFAPQPEATVHFALTEGTKVIVREDRGQWFFVERADGRQGWVRAEAVERI